VPSSTAAVSPSARFSPPSYAAAARRLSAPPSPLAALAVECGPLAAIAARRAPLP
jgi:hypothetical protein